MSRHDPEHRDPWVVLEDVAWLTECGTPFHDIARRVGLKQESLRTLLLREDRRDLIPYRYERQEPA